MRLSLLLCAVASAFVSTASAGVFTAKFEPGLPGWKIENMENRMSFEAATHEGVPALVIRPAATTNAVVGDTAWTLESVPFPVRAGERLSVVVRSRGTVAKMLFPQGYGGKYQQGVAWYDRDGKELTQQFFGFGLNVEPDRWLYSAAFGIVPDRAVTARVRLAADRPNFTKTDVLAVSDVRVATVSAATQGGSRTTLRDDGAVLVDGKPFFPIGLYGVAPHEPVNGGSLERAFADIKAAGFNTVEMHGAAEPNYTPFLDLCEKYGFMTFTVPALHCGIDIYRKGHIAREMRRKCVLAWYVGDDTASYQTPSEVASKSALCKVFDPDRLTLQADVTIYEGINRYVPYVFATDVFLPEIYPCRAPTTNDWEVAEVVRDMRAIRFALAQAGNPTRSIWPIIQHFDGWSSWKRFPTFAELRAMSWVSLVYGGKGITWYTYTSPSGRGRGAAQIPEHWRELSAVVREIGSLQEDLVAYDAPHQPRVKVTAGPTKDAFGNPPVSVLLKDGDRPLLMAVNATTNTVSALIGVRGYAKVSVIGENRTLDATKVLADTFGPYAVHLYRLK